MRSRIAYVLVKDEHVNPTVPPVAGPTHATEHSTRPREWHAKRGGV